ncbi:uncharacterized protein LOC131284079 [Anopheles ziemanni]|uniref:uncharacterized protein LOC131261302 n=1 Tax=Anopheles coustani TaxID=139045 RepID=UPI0026585241|nr:uncharacterized protein LOC131261302 [Anopheles coustani]XP_058168917.1 uncharacterized protein LOC131284079 [Anopheles ziemanni]
MSRKNRKIHELSNTADGAGGTTTQLLYDARRAQLPSLSTSSATHVATPAPRNGARNVANDQTERATIHTPEAIASFLMQVTEKKDRCIDFDLQYWLTKYVSTRTEANFPVAGMLINCAAHIYGRKVDYLSDIVIHMNDNQKSREEKQVSEENGENSEEPAQNTSTVRKRTGRFNPESLSDCFSDLEFTCNDKKLLKIDDLINPPVPVEVDRRTKVEQMMDLCRELRANPTRQRRQELLNRLRDDANIAPMLSSNGVARRNQILDLESGETIGTRYDYQTHLNYIDGRTGSLRAEHDLKRFFQRCDVIDFLSEQSDLERERCTRLGMAAPVDLLSAKARELKIFMPPEYLKDHYRINVNDTSDFDNALIQARVTNYSSDPILALMNAEEREKRYKQIEQEEEHDTSVTVNETNNDSGYGNDSAITEDPSFKEVLSSSLLNETQHNNTSASQHDTENSTIQTSTEENPLESELLALEANTSSQANGEGEKPTGTASRLSVDEGIGVDHESPTRSPSATLEMGNKVLFTSGNIIPRQMYKPPNEKLLLNLFGLPEKTIKKSSIFALPVEYRKLKADLTRRRKQQAIVSSEIVLHSLHPDAPRNSLWVERPSTPDLEDFLGFDDDEAPDVGKHAVKKSNKFDRPSTPECDFPGFTEEEVAIGHRNAPATLALAAKDVVNLSSPTRSPGKQRQTGDGTSSQPVTPSRTLSCDSGISDTAPAERGKDTSAGNSGLEPIMSEHEDGGFDSSDPDPETTDGRPLKEHTDASNARIQHSVAEAKERIEKVNAWHKKLKPILIESEQRNHFDIHAYGTEIIETFDATEVQANPGDLHRPTITLATVLQNKPAHSTARYFLSMLMLANTNNVEITNKNSEPLRISTAEEIELRLLSRKRHHQQMMARKRKLMSSAGQEATDEPEANTTPQVAFRPDPMERLAPDTATVGNFMDSVEQVYSALNSEESKRKRLAFRRGMRNRAYGIQEEKEGEATSSGTSTKKPRTGEPPPPPPPLVAKPQPAPPPDNIEPFVEDEILQVDLSTHHAMFISGQRESHDGCAQSVFSFAESGYESMISDK